MEVVLNKMCSGKFNNLNMVFSDNLITGVYDEENTNLLEIISLLSKIDSGEIILDEYVYTKKVKKISQELRRKIGFVSRFSEKQLFNLTVKEELELAFKLLEKESNIDSVIEVMNMVDLDIEFLDRDPFTLSNGEKRKLSIASVLIFNPDVIIIENPFVALDIESKKSLFNLFKKLKNDYKKTVIFSSNDIEDIYRISDYVYLLKNSEIVLSGKRSIIYENKEVLKEKNILLPQLVNFSDYVLSNKGIKLGYRYEMNDLIKDIYRYAR